MKTSEVYLRSSNFSIAEYGKIISLEAQLSYNESLYSKIVYDDDNIVNKILAEDVNVIDREIESFRNKHGIVRSYSFINDKNRDVLKNLIKYHNEDIDNFFKNIATILKIR